MIQVQERQQKLAMVQIVRKRVRSQSDQVVLRKMLVKGNSYFFLQMNIVTHQCFGRYHFVPHPDIRDIYSKYI